MGEYFDEGVLAAWGGGHAASREIIDSGGGVGFYEPGLDFLVCVDDGVTCVI